VATWRAACWRTCSGHCFCLRYRSLLYPVSRGDFAKLSDWRARDDISTAAWDGLSLSLQALSRARHGWRWHVNRLRTGVSVCGVRILPPRWNIALGTCSGRKIKQPFSTLPARTCICHTALSAAGRPWLCSARRKSFRCPPPRTSTRLRPMHYITIMALQPRPLPAPLQFAETCMPLQ